MSSAVRGMAFIDFDNINIGARRYHGIKGINFTALRRVLLEGYVGVGCTVYLPDRMKNLIPYIQRSGLRVQVVSPGKSVDGRLIFDLFVNTIRDTFDIAVIASGDRDYIPVIEEVHRMKKEVIIASFSKSLSNAIKNAVGNTISLDDHVDTIALKINEYTCSKCGKKFSVPFTIFGKAPLCQDCFRSK